jgi:hypothetical protein
MRQTIGIILFCCTFLLAKGQNNGFEHELASKLGLCSNQNYHAMSTDFPCKQCKISFVPLQSSRAKDQLFFIEASSPLHCGSGGCTGTVYEKKGNQYIALSHVFGFFDGTVSRGSQVPDLTYIHVEFPKRDYNNDGVKDKATFRVRYRWNPDRSSFDVVDILSIDVYGAPVNPMLWKKRLIREWQAASPWVN